MRENINNIYEKINDQYMDETNFGKLSISKTNKIEINT